MREEIILDLVLNSTWDLFQMPQLRELQCTQIQHACRNIQRAKRASISCAQKNSPAKQSRM